MLGSRICVDLFLHVCTQRSTWLPIQIRRTLCDKNFTVRFSLCTKDISTPLFLIMSARMSNFEANLQWQMRKKCKSNKMEQIKLFIACTYYLVKSSQCLKGHVGSHLDFCKLFSWIYWVWSFGYVVRLHWEELINKQLNIFQKCLCINFESVTWQTAC